MADVLFVTMDGGGNVQPMLEVAAAVADRGHQVRIIGHVCLHDVVVRAGLPFQGYRTAKPWDSTRQQSPLRWVPMFNDRNIGADVRQVCAQNRPDVAVVDCMLLPALSALHELDIPHVVFSHTYRGYLNRLHRLGAGTAARLYGYRITKIWNRADLNIVTTIGWLDPDSRRPQPANVRWVGAVVAARQQQPRSDPPLVLVSMSTNGFRGQGRTLRRIISALTTLPVRAIVTTGGVIDPATLPAAPNVQIVAYSDHRDVLPECSLLIGHGGHSTTFRALAHDIPVLVIPASPMADQRLIGTSIARAGAGLTLRRAASQRALRTAINRLLTEPRWRTAAARIGRELRASEAAGTAADLITNLA